MNAGNNKPRLLLLARFFPPFRVLSIRTTSLARYLPRMGWDVTVVTPRPDIWNNVGDVDEAEASMQRDGIKKILTGHSWRCLDPDVLNVKNTGITRIYGGVCRRIARRYWIDSAYGWIKEAEKACSKLVPGDIDVILASAAPFASFALAKQLSDRLKCPYVMDYRDPWTKNPHAVRPIPEWLVRRERSLLAGCSSTVIVSRSWASLMDQAFHIGAKLHVIPNGYDPQELENVTAHNFSHFAIVYLGVFYPPKRVIAPILSALKMLQTSGNGSRPWYFHYYGNQEQYVRDEAVRYGVMEKVVLHGTVSRKEALAAVRGADVAVVITSVLDEEDSADRGIIPGKLFEPLGLQTPVLLICPAESDAAEIVADANAGEAFRGSNIQGIAGFISEKMQGDRRLQPSSSIQDWSWPQLIARYDSVLRRAAGTSLRNEARDFSMFHNRSGN